MSRTFSALRPLKATTAPSAVCVVAVSQHSQTRRSTIISAPGFPSRAYTLARSAMSSFGARPSSQTTPKPPLGTSKSDAKPCCVWLLSAYGLTGADQVRPSSFDQESRRVEASGSGPFCCVQCATSAPSLTRRTEGTSAELTMRRSLETTVCASVHPADVRSENFSAPPAPPRPPPPPTPGLSIQLSTV